MRSVFQDLRYAIRVLGKKPGFSGIAILTLALGIGANAAIFSVVYGILLRPLPYPEPQQLMAVQWGRGAEIEHNDLTGPEVKFLDEQLPQQKSSMIEAMAVKSDFAPVNLIFGGSAQSVPSLKVSSQYFHVLGVQPQIGNGFGPEQDQTGAPAEAVLSHSLWVNAFAGNSSVLGKTIDLNGQEYTVKGVMPATFESYPAAAVYLPFHLDEHDNNYPGTNYTTIVRIKSGFTREQAQAQFEALTAELLREHPDAEHWRQFHFSLTDYRQSLMQRSETSARDLFILQIAVGFVLLIACTNLASLLFARGSGRSHEISVRIALGASRSRILRMLLIEDLLLACAGGIIALLLAFAAVPLLIAASPVELPRTSDIHVSGAVVLFTLGAVIVATLLFGVAPALRLFLHNRTNLAEGAKSVTASQRQAFAGRALMVAQTAIALVLLAGATLMFRSFLKIVAVPPGFQTQRLLTFQVPLTDKRYQKIANTEQFATDVVAKLQALPGVSSASYVNTMPFVTGVNGYVVPHGRKDIQVNFATEVRGVTPGFFETLRSPILEGRGISESDTATSSPVVVINKTLADRWWPKQNPIGQSVNAGEGSVREVVGVSADLHESSLDQKPAPMIVEPLTQFKDGDIAYINRLFPASFLIRTKTNVDLANQIREAVHSVDPELPVENIRPMEEVIDVTLAGPRFFGSLFGAFAGFALLLTAIGIYGLLSYLVNQKVREIGVRMALGASRKQVLGVFLRQALLISALGIVIGVLGAIGLTRFLRAFLFEVRPSDPTALALAAVLLAITALIAALVPALRATRVNPVVALRYE